MHHDLDLDVLNIFSNDELEPLVKLITEKGSLSQTLTKSKEYKMYYPDHKKYVEQIKNTLSFMGGNSFANWFRRHGVSYREILRDVCNKLDISFDSKIYYSIDVWKMEQRLLEKILENSWKKMDQQEKETVLTGLNADSNISSSMTTSALISLFRADKKFSYRFSLITANTLCQSMSGRGLALVRNATLVGTLLLGAPGVLISAIRVAGPAYRVTVPAVAYIAALRNIYRLKELDNTWNQAACIIHSIYQSRTSLTSQATLDNSTASTITWQDVAYGILKYITKKEPDMKFFLSSIGSRKIYNYDSALAVAYSTLIFMQQKETKEKFFQEMKAQGEPFFYRMTVYHMKKYPEKPLPLDPPTLPHGALPIEDMRPAWYTANYIANILTGNRIESASDGWEEYICTKNPNYIKEMRDKDSIIRK